MTTSTVLKTLAIVSTSVVVLAGCSTQTTSIPSITPVPAAENDTNMMVAPNTVTATPEAAQPTLSKSTKTDDLKKELDDTTVKAEDFSDL
ncbi:MAG: hypothetical protein ABI425_03180 [Patescibacteria group bacterium]